ncbi:phospho-N-acetylmuramoyl-pentapeptide-transferase [Candidatus Synechococcus calcipolaris G9]|uniref:Phospho-N-acetylmuramoyl-pentapeptide-transferase n=1 Tax=Candidatus Synechococcus calcipolaris G9 TaxID=1497997 RepID=A0ABT6EXW4_9SYNE|nr:phospho-N-acetylmuramoyl-pentapeptide-transferase [Candidatus Synechococcus calcipolaris]MDG2990081.1 phospho-N-acetylmuramoyl-pentapeptide-transferase [Candidatus Synechococcus calcipolaris G9]
MTPTKSESLATPSFLTGRRLFICLTLILLGMAIASDVVFKHWQQPAISFTLPLVGTATLTALMGQWVVPLLRRLKTGQVIREDGPQSHLKKSGTPTMGGIFLIPTGLLVALAWTGLGLEQWPLRVLAIALLTTVYGGIGWWDDWQVLVRKSNKGMSARLRLLLEGGAALCFAAWLLRMDPTVTTIQFSWGWALPLGLLFIPLAIFVPMAEGNAVNLTDGLDGLAAGTVAIALLSLGILVAADFPDLMILTAAMAGACLGFLWHNHHPARVFMGDTGSLALGAVLAGIGLVSHHLWELLIISGLFLAESLSVIAQVGYYKATKGPDGIGKRLFKMAPLHHHFELSGWSELRVVATFYLVVLVLGFGAWLQGILPQSYF